MVSQLQSFVPIVYPDSDSKPMADNPKQFRWAEATLDEERRRAEALAERLRAAGIDPDNIAL